MSQNTDLLRMLQELHELIVDAPRYVGKVAWGINRDEAAIQIAKIRASLPDELKRASARVKESERLVDSAREDASSTLDGAKKQGEKVVDDAHKEAEKIVELGRVQQGRLVAESEILKLAKAQAEEIRNSADRDAVQVRRGADQYAYEVLLQLEGVVGRVAAVIERGKQDLERPAESAVVPSRERTRA